MNAWTTFRPSTADSTEIAGVIMLSPKNNAAPKMPSAASVAAALRPCFDFHSQPHGVVRELLPIGHEQTLDACCPEDSRSTGAPPGVTQALTRPSQVIS